MCRIATDLHLVALPAAAPIRSLPASATSEWGIAVLRNLSQVEDLLDSLENRGIAEREVTALDGCTFAVRWR